MKHMAEQILASMAAHDDEERFINDCAEKAEQIVYIGYDETTTGITWHFPDSSRIEFDPRDKYIRAYSPSKHRVP